MDKKYLKFVTLICILLLSAGCNDSTSLSTSNKEPGPPKEINQAERQNEIKNFRHASDATKNYSNDFFTFNYPESYDVTLNKITTEHNNTIRPPIFDLFGNSVINLEDKDTGLTISITALPQNSGLPYTFEDVEAQYAKSKIYPEDLLKYTTVDNKKALLWYQVGDSSRVGFEEVTLITKKYIYTFSMDWSADMGILLNNYPNNVLQKDFDTILNSFHIK